MEHHHFGRLRALAHVGADRSGAFRYGALAVAWLALWRLSAVMQYDPHASLWFPPAGLTLAAMLVMGWRALPVLVPCAIVATFWIDRIYGTDLPARALLVSGIVFAMAHCLSYGLGALVMRRAIRRSTSPSTPVVVTAFLLVSALASLSATVLGIRGLEATGLIAASAPPLWLPWWIGDLAGALVLTPLFVGLLSWRYPQIEPWLGGLSFLPQSRGSGTYAGKLALEMLVVIVVLAANAYLGTPEAAFAMFFLILPQMWVVYTESPFRSALSIALVSTAIALLVALFGITREALVYQFAICVIAASGYFGFAVPALVAQNRHLSELATTDGLTGAATKTHFFECSERELADVRSQGLPVSLLVMDIDRFKAINDGHGHAAGDQVLVGLVRTLRHQLRQSDLVGRFGGDEFMVLLPGLALDRAEATAERLRRALAEMRTPGLAPGLSVSFGVAAVGDGEGIMEAFRRADDRLLEAKQHRRDAAAATA